MEPVLTSSSTQYWRIPAQKFQQGRRTVYSFVMTVGEIDGFLPERVDDNVIRDANRRLTPRHARDIEEYLQSNPNSWVLGALMLGVASDAVEFTPYPVEGGVHPTLGELAIKLNRKGTLRIFDGQHRRRALHDALGATGIGELSPLHSSSLPIVLYVESDIKALRQMFADAAKAKSIEKNTVTQFDTQDPFNLAAQYLTTKSVLFQSGGVELQKSSVGRTSTRLLAINQLAVILKTLRVGYGGRVRRERMAEIALDQAALNADCLAWADKFLVAARGEYEALAQGEYTGADLPRLRRETYAVTVTFLRVLTGAFYMWLEDGKDWQSLAEWMREANLDVNPADGEMSLPARAGLIQQGGGLSGRSHDVGRAIRLIVLEATNAMYLTHKKA